MNLLSSISLSEAIKITKIIVSLGLIKWLISRRAPSVTITYPQDDENDWKGDLEGTFRLSLFHHFKTETIIILLKRRDRSYYTVLGTPNIIDQGNWKLNNRTLAAEKLHWTLSKIHSPITKNKDIEEIMAIVTGASLAQGQEVKEHEIPKALAKHSVRRIDDNSLHRT